MLFDVHVFSDFAHSMLIDIKQQSAAEPPVQKIKIENIVKKGKNDYFQVHYIFITLLGTST